MRLTTGVAGFDEMVQGGLPAGTSVVLQGPPGQEKVRFALTFLAEGLKAGASGLVLVSSQSPDSILAELRNLGVDLDAVVRENRLRIVDWYTQREEPVQDVEERGVVLRSSIDLTNVGVALSRAIAALGGSQPKRAVVELLSPAMSVYEVGQVYAFAQSSRGKFARFGYTALFLVEKDMHPAADLSTLHQPFDGVVEIERTRIGDRIVRKIGVLHMKDTTPDSAFRVLEMTEKGLQVVHALETAQEPQAQPEPEIRSTPPAAQPKNAPVAEKSTTPESKEESPTRAYLIMQIARERLKLNPGDPDALFAMAAAQATLDDVRGALESLDRLSKLDERYPGLWVLKTKLHARLGEADRARASRAKAEQTKDVEGLPPEIMVNCPLCDAVVSERASQCPKCGARFLTEADMEGELDALGQAAIQEKVREELGDRDLLAPGGPKPEARPEKPKPTRKPKAAAPPKKAAKPAGRQGFTNGSVRERAAAAKPVGMTNGLRGRTNGLTNGLRGRTNGLTNGLGRTNGLTNGLRGRTNGLTNGLRGRTNGLTNGLGRTNGVTNGLTNGLVSLRRGITNGLTNGNGFTNGLGSPRFHREIRLNRWKLYVIPIVVMALLLVPLFTPPEFANRLYPIQIDGQFADWSGVPRIGSFASSGIDPNGDITQVAVTDNIDFLSFLVEVRGTALQGAPSPDRITDAFFVFLDVDRTAATGYRIQGLGADRLVEIDGWGGQVTSATVSEFDVNRNPHDWSGWLKSTPVSAAASGSQVEFEVDWEALATSKTPIPVAFGARTWSGQVDLADMTATTVRPYVLVTQDTVAPQVVTGTTTPIARFSFRAVGGDIQLSGVNITLSGTYQASTFSTMALIDEGGNLITRAPVSGGRVALSFSGITVLDGGELIWTLQPAVNANDGTTIGAIIVEERDVIVSTGGVALWAPVSVPASRAYVGGVPVGPLADGGFAEWTNVSSDPLADVTPSRSLDTDLTGYAFQGVSGSVLFFAETLGTALNGTLLPTTNPAYTENVSSEPDSDRDSVPDVIDPFPNDFNNDGIPDAATNGDYDADGVVDYGFAGGTDNWLNTTLPSTFPAPYAGRSVTLFVGPVERPPATGEDTARFYLDWDGSSGTGYSIGGIGADYLLEVSGKAGMIFSSEARRFDGVGPWQWAWVDLGQAPAGKDRSRIEVGLVGVPATNNSRAFVDLTGWAGAHDDTLPTAPTKLLSSSLLRAMAIGADDPAPTSAFGVSASVAEPLLTFTSGYGGAAGDKYGYNVSYAGKIDETSGGYDDVIVGAPYVDFASVTDRGAIYIHFGTTSMAGIDTRYFHDETITANTVTTEKLVVDAPDGSNPKTRSTSAATGGRFLLDEWTTQRLGVSQLNGGTWTFYYWGDVGSTSSVVANFDVHIYKRSASGTLTAIDGTDGNDATPGVAASPNLPTSPSEVTGTFTMTEQTIDMSDAVVIRLYAIVTTPQNGKSVTFSLDHTTRNSRVVTTIPSTTVDSNDADVVIYGEAANDHFGWSVSDAGDVNGDGYGDVLVGAPDAGGTGKAYLIYGRSTAAWGTASGNAISSVTNVVTISGQASGDKFGSSVSGAGNVDGSGYVDFVVGAYASDSSAGRVYVFLGDGSIPTLAIKADALLSRTAPFLYKQGSFTRKTDGTGTQSVTGVGFQPKALIVWYSRVTDELHTTNDRGGFGFAASATQRYSTATASDTGAATTNTGRGSAAGIVRIFSDGTPTLDGAADLKSFDVDGFTLDWTTNPNPAHATILHYIALGGDAITNVFVGQFTGPAAAATGNRAFTGVGFRGDFGLFMTTHQAALGDLAHQSFGIGAAVGGTKRGALSGGGNDAATAVTHAESYVSTSKTLVSYKPGSTPGALQPDNIADFVSWDADGFTLSYSQVTTGDILFWALILKGGRYDVGNFQIPNTGTTPFDQSVSSVGFKPKGVMFLSDNTDSVDTENGDYQRMIGAASDAGGSVRQDLVWNFNRNIVNTDSSMRTKTTKSIGLYSATGSTQNEADYKSSDPSGFTVTHTAISAGTKRVIYIAFGDANTAVGSKFGFSVSEAGDVNNDGRGDIIVGAPGAAKAYVYSLVSNLVSNGYIDVDASSWTYTETDAFTTAAGAWENTGGSAGVFSGAGSYKFSFASLVWYYHSETHTINTVTTEKLVPDSPDGASIQSRSVTANPAGRYLLDEWMTPQLGWTSIPAGTWQFYFWGYAQNPVVAHFDVHIYKRDSSGTLTPIDDTDGNDLTDGVADTANLGTASAELTSTFSMSAQSLASTDALVIKIYLDVTSGAAGKVAVFEFDHSTRNSRVITHLGQDATFFLTSASSFTSPSGFDTVQWRFAWTSTVSGLGSGTYRVKYIVRNGGDTADVATAYDSGLLTSATAWTARSGTVTGLSPSTAYRVRIVVELDNPNTASTPTFSVNVDDIALTFSSSTTLQGSQFGRPDGDTDTGTWTTTPLYAKLDEGIPDDADVVSATVSGWDEVSLTDMKDPPSSYGHIIRFRAFATGNGPTERMKVDLYQGTTFIATTGYQDISRTAFTTYTYTLTTAEADAISNYADLRFRLDLGQIGGGSERIDLSWAELEVSGAGTNFGWSVSTAGNVNNDGTGYADVIVGAPDALKGTVSIFYGGSPLDATVDVTIIGGASGDRLGFSVAYAGDINVDGVADVVVGAPYAENGALADAGAVYVFKGSTSLATVLSTADAGYQQLGSTGGDHFGWSVSRGGDTNGDGSYEILVGAPDATEPLAGSAPGGVWILKIPEFEQILYPLAVFPLILIGIRLNRSRRRGRRPAR